MDEYDNELLPTASSNPTIECLWLACVNGFNGSMDMYEIQFCIEMIQTPKLTRGIEISTLQLSHPILNTSLISQGVIYLTVY